ncbi:M50 family metallopeptidase [Dehalobacter sp. TBBPA1]|uniref:M50 family metallopeptidase n=1 Tax=Dehalobacter sp. TBBPA1 TaxID=3235037 RepID=UPI0034A1C5E2
MKVKVHPTFIILLILCMLAGQVVRALLVFSLVIVHEACHILAARGYGIRCRSIELYPYGGTAVLDDSFEGKKKEETIIAFAGPAVNVVLFFFIQILRENGILSGAWALEFAKTNFWLAAFNLLPVLPLDGGRIVRGLLAGSFGFVSTTRFLAAAGKCLGGAFVFAGFLMQGMGFYIYEPVLFIVLGIFFWIGSGKELDNARIVFLKQLCRKKERLLAQGLMPGRSLAVSRDTALKQIIDKFSADHFSLVSVMGKDDKIERMLSETEVIQGMMDFGLNCMVGKLKEE